METVVELTAEVLVSLFFLFVVRVQFYKFYGRGLQGSYALTHGHAFLVIKKKDTEI